MQASTSSGSNKIGDKPVDKDNATSAEKETLLRDIEELKRMIRQCESSLETLRFADVEKRHATELQSLRHKRDPYYNRAPNVEIDIKNDLYRFGGLYCSQFRKHELIFSFTSAKEQQGDSTNALQVFVKDGKARLGKWVMPMSVDMNQILSKTPIDDAGNLPSLVKTCKHYADCYSVRQEQFNSLKERLSNMKHYVLHSNMGYTQIGLELYGVYDTEDDKYINLTIYLIYYSDNARPYKIEVDAADKNSLSDDVKRRLKTSLREFKMSDLQTAFERVLMEENSAFTWLRKERDDSDNSPVEQSDTSDSEEENHLTQAISNRKRSLRKAKRKRELQKKWNERKKRKGPMKSIALDQEEDQEDQEKDEEEEEDQECTQSHSKTKLSRTESSRRISARNVASISRQQKRINENLAEETTPLMNPKVKLKQIKLDFHINQTTNSDNADKNFFRHPKRNKTYKKTPIVATSTPLNMKSQFEKMSLSSSLEMDNITRIDSPKQTADKLNDSSNILNEFRRSKRVNDKSINKTNDSENSNKSNAIRRSNEELDSLKNTNKFNDSRMTDNEVKNSGSNSNRTSTSKSIVKLKDSKSSNVKPRVPKPNTTSGKKKINEARNRASAKSTLRVCIPKIDRHLKSNKTKF